MTIPVDNTGDTGLGPVSLGLTWTLVGLAIITVAARFIVHKRALNKWSADHWIMLLALVIQIIYQSIFTVLVGWGGSLRFDRITPLQRRQANKWGWISAAPSIMTSCIARISIAILLVRIFNVYRLLKLYLIIFTSILTILSILSIIFLAAQCTPWSGLWDRTVSAKCWNPFIYAYTALATQFLYAISDFTFVLFPVIIIWKINMTTRRKAAVIALMTLSLITMGIVVAKIVMILLRLTTPQAATSTLARYFQTLTNLIASLEQSLVIIMGCIPTLKLHGHFKLPTLSEVSSFVARLVPSSWSIRSRQPSPYSSGGEGVSYQDLELVPKVRLANEESDIKPYTVTLKGDSQVKRDLT